MSASWLSVAPVHPPKFHAGGNGHSQLTHWPANAPTGGVVAWENQGSDSRGPWLQEREG